jgi:hypothetical protein
VRIAPPARSAPSPAEPRTDGADEIAQVALAVPVAGGCRTREPSPNVTPKESLRDDADPIEDRLTPSELAARYLRRFDWRRSRAPGPPPPCRVISTWERWIDREPERAWPLFVTLVRLRPDDDEVLEQVWYRLCQLLARHGRAYAARVRALVEGNARLARIAPPVELDPAAHRPRLLDIPALIAAYLENAAHSPDRSELDEVVHDEPGEALPLVLEIISRGPLHGLGSRDTAQPLVQLLRLHGAEVIDAVERAAAESVLVRRCLWRAERHQHHPPAKGDIAPEVWARASRAHRGTTDYSCDDPPGVAHPLLPGQERLVEAWFASHRTFWAYERMDDLVANDPEPAWRVVNRLIAEAQDAPTLGLIAAGPLEMLLERHGAYFIDRVEIRARDDETFRECLRGVWQAEIPDDIWTRVQAASGDEM